MVPRGHARDDAAHQPGEHVVQDGNPCGPSCHTVGAPKRSAPLRAKVAASACWCSPSMWTPTYSARDTAGQLEAPVPMPKESIGGFADTELREVAVKPTGPVPPGAVITATPAACRLKTERRRSGEATRGVRGRAWPS